MHFWEVHHQPETRAASTSLSSTYRPPHSISLPPPVTRTKPRLGFPSHRSEGVCPRLPNKRSPHSSFHPAGSHSWVFSAQILPTKIPDPTQEECSPQALPCCPWLKAAQSGPCIPLRTLQKGWCPQECPPGTWARCGLAWTEADCSYLPGATEAKMLTGNWPQRSSLPAPSGAGRLPPSPHWQRGPWQALWSRGSMESAPKP